MSDLICELCLLSNIPEAMGWYIDEIIKVTGKQIYTYSLKCSNCGNTTFFYPEEGKKYKSVPI